MQRNVIFSIRKLIDKNMSLQDILSLLIETDYELMIGHYIARDQDADSVKEYVDFLVECYKFNIRRDTVNELLLRAKNDVNANIGSVIAECHDAALLMYFLDRLNTLIEHGLDANQVIASFGEKNSSDWFLVLIIAHKFDITTLSLLFETLSHFMKHDVDVEQVFSLLQTKGPKDLCMGETIAVKRDAACNIKYLEFLASLLEKGLEARKILEELQIEAPTGFNYQHHIMKHQDGSVLCSYMDLLVSCLKKGCRRISLHDHLISPLPGGIFSRISILHDSIHRKDPALLYKIINSSLLNDNDFAALVTHKRIVLAYIVTLPKERAIGALQRCKDANRSLGKFIRGKTGNFTDNTPEMLKLVDSHLEELQGEFASLTAQSTTAVFRQLVPIYIGVHKIKDAKVRQKEIDRQLAAGKQFAPPNERVLSPAEAQAEYTAVPKVMPSRICQPK